MRNGPSLRSADALYGRLAIPGKRKRPGSERRFENGWAEAVLAGADCLKLEADVSQLLKLKSAVQQRSSS